MKLHMLSCKELSDLARTLRDKSPEKNKVLQELLSRDNSHWHTKLNGTHVQRPRRRLGSNGLLTIDSYAL